ncbi:MAG: 4Fe-4S dicluster domain-containing protein [Candidatus Omnitrophica bacterium]|nr:4Fe-4S dicluster domain-containing protein [Candidatus Omnitrophota bacterium]
MRYPKLRELKEAVKALILGPYTDKFPYKPHEPYERFRGRPQYHEEDCIGCAACVQVCPSGALSFSDKNEGGKARRVLTHRIDLCVFCGQCQANCPTEKGIMLTREFDLSSTQSRQELNHAIEKEMLLCDGCGEMIVPADQYKWVANKLGPLMFSNPSVFLSYLGLGENEGRSGREIKKPDRFKIICPRCRREAVLKS